ncbi:MAG: Na(+)/H(+) antiporter subunit B [Rhodospirillaceae bacterium]
MKAHSVLRTSSKVLIPPIMLFGLYVQFHGDFGPGGGFQAGVLFAVAFILYSLVIGFDKARRVAPPGVMLSLSAVGLMIYVGTGFVTMFLGANFLDYDVLASNHISAQHYGIIAVEVGVGVAVATVMIGVFFAFAGRGR